MQFDSTLVKCNHHSGYPGQNPARERGPTTECRPTPHFWLNFLLRSNAYSNMHPCVAALEKRSSNG
jgi:hypothetical protein